MAYDQDYIKERITITESGCWEWNLSTFPDTGYGQCCNKSGEMKAHRLAYKIFNGAIPEGRIVMHTCDNRTCCNPEHLIAASQSDNIMDASRKGRLTRHKTADDIVQDIVAMFKDGYTKTDIANEHGLSRAGVRKILNRQGLK